MSTPTKNKRTSRKPSQTARILETVELLLALHEEQGNQRSESQEQVELLSKQLAELESKISSMADSHGDSAPALPDQFQQQVHQAIDEKLDRFLENLETRLDSQQNDTPEVAEPQADWNQLEANLYEHLEQQLDNGFSMLLEEFSSPKVPADPTAESLISKINDQLNDQFNQWRIELQDSLSEQIASAISKSGLPESDSDGIAAIDSSQSLEPLTEHLDRQIEKLNESIEGQLENRLEVLADRFEKLEKQSSAVQSQLTNLETQAVFSGTSSVTSVEPSAEWMGKLEEKLGDSSRSLLSDVELHLDELYDRLTTRLGSSPSVSEDNLSPQVAPSDNDSASHWEKQKRAMLQKYGIDPEKRPLEEEKKREQEVKEKQASAAEKLNGLHDSIANISPEDSEAIEKLKKDLNSKLRDAEVELSINRAKLSQERAELDQQRTELEQRMADLEAKLASRDQNPGDKKGGFMNRFTRHLGK